MPAACFQGKTSGAIGFPGQVVDRDLAGADHTDFDDNITGDIDVVDFEGVDGGIGAAAGAELLGFALGNTVDEELELTHSTAGEGFAHIDREIRDAAGDGLGEDPGVVGISAKHESNTVDEVTIVGSGFWRYSA